MRFSSAFLMALCVAPLLLRSASAQIVTNQTSQLPGQDLRPTQLFSPSSSVWGGALTPEQSRALGQRSLEARDRAFGWLEAQAGAVEAPNFNSLGGQSDLESATWNRYRAVTADETLSRRQRERVIAGMVHQDLQLAEVGLEQTDPAVGRRALRLASIATLYSGMLEDDPRLPSALYEGFLLPHLDLAPPRGWSGSGAILEGASVAFGRSGRAQERREVLLTLLGRQTGAGDTAGADMTRVHLADAFAAEGYYQNAIDMLSAVTSPDLLGARAMLTELGEDLIQSNRVNREAWESARQAAIDGRIAAGGGATGAQPLAANTTAQNGAAPDGGAPLDATGAPAGGAGGLGAGGLGASPGGAIGGNGPRLAQGGAGGQREAQTGGTATETTSQDEARPGESEKMRRVRLAAEASRRAQELSKDAQEKATVALALWLDASEAQTALEAGEVGRVPAPRASAARARQ